MMEACDFFTISLHVKLYFFKCANTTELWKGEWTIKSSFSFVIKIKINDVLGFFCDNISAI